eukprot:3985875-Alexandrium_andersonii.AAC.1
MWTGACFRGARAKPAVSGHWLLETFWNWELGEASIAVGRSRDAAAYWARGPARSSRSWLTSRWTEASAA